MIATRLTERLGLAVPIVSAPMAFAAGGRLAIRAGEIMAGMVAEAEALLGGAWRRAG